MELSLRKTKATGGRKNRDGVQGNTESRVIQL